MTTDSLEIEILKLSKDDQLSLIGTMIKNLNHGSDELSTKQIEEVDRRFDEIKNGTAKTVAAKQVFSELAKKYVPKS